MAEVIEEGKILTFDELRILLFACGIEEINGVFMPEKVFTEEEVLSALHHMAEREIIRAEETDFTIREDIREILNIMGHPENAFVWSPKEGSIFEDEYYCYIVSGKVVVSEQYWKKKETVKLRMFSLEDFDKWKEELRNTYDYY